MFNVMVIAKMVYAQVMVLKNVILIVASLSLDLILPITAKHVLPIVQDVMLVLINVIQDNAILDLS